jgi:hypothetical protein
MSLLFPIKKHIHLVVGWKCVEVQHLSPILCNALIIPAAINKGAASTDWAAPY